MRGLQGYIEDHRRGSTVELVNMKRVGKGYPLHVEVQELVKVGQKISTTTVQRLTIAPGKQIITHLDPRYRVKAWWEWPPEIYHSRGLTHRKTQIYEGYEQGTFREDVQSRHRRPFDGFSSRFFRKQAQLTKEQYYDLVVKRQAIPQTLWKHSYKLLDKEQKERDRRARERRKIEAAAEKKRRAAATKKEIAAEKKKKGQEKKKAAAHEERIRKAEAYSRKGKFKQGARYAMDQAKKAEARGETRRANELWELSRKLQAEVVYTKPRGKKAKVAGATRKKLPKTVKQLRKMKPRVRYPKVEKAIRDWVREHTPETGVASLELLYYDVASHMKTAQTKDFERKVRSAMKALVARGSAVDISTARARGLYKVTV